MTCHNTLNALGYVNHANIT